MPETPQNEPAPAPKPQPGPSNRNTAAAPPAQPPATKGEDVNAQLVETLRSIAAQGPAGPAMATPGLDETVRDGRYYIARGQAKVLVDAHGRDLNEDGSLVNPRDIKVDAFGRVI